MRSTIQACCWGTKLGRLGGRSGKQQEGVVPDDGVGGHTLAAEVGVAHAAGVAEHGGGARVGSH